MRAQDAGASGEGGPSRTFSGFGSLSKVLLAPLVILGRLEVFAVRVILPPGFWRQSGHQSQEGFAPLPNGGGRLRRAGVRLC